MCTNGRHQWSNCGHGMREHPFIALLFPQLGLADVVVPFVVIESHGVVGVVVVVVVVAEQLFQLPKRQTGQQH